MSNSWDPDQAGHFVRPGLVPNCLQRLSADIAGKELNTKHHVDTFWLKPWLKLILFGSNFFHLVKVLASTNSEPCKPWISVSLSILGPKEHMCKIFDDQYILLHKISAKHF